MDPGVAEASTDGKCHYFHQFMADLVVDIFDSLAVGPGRPAITQSPTHSPVNNIYYTNFNSFLNTEF